MSQGRIDFGAFRLTETAERLIFSNDRVLIRTLGSNFERSGLRLNARVFQLIVNSILAMRGLWFLLS